LWWRRRFRLRSAVIQAFFSGLLDHPYSEGEVAILNSI